MGRDDERSRGVAICDDDLAQVKTAIVDMLRGAFGRGAVRLATESFDVLPEPIDGAARALAALRQRERNPDAKTEAETA